MTNAEQRAAAKAFAKKWQGRGYEKGESQIFWGKASSSQTAACCRRSSRRSATRQNCRTPNDRAGL